jgi:hypothetical protein
MNPQNIEDDLAASEFFKGFDKADIEKVAAICDRQGLRSRQPSFSAGRFRRTSVYHIRWSGAPGTLDVDREPQGKCRH